MRQSWSNLELITFEGGAMAGISLGFDYTAAHEEGIRPIERALGINHQSKEGIEKYSARAISHHDARLTLYEREKATKTIAAETRLSFCTVPSIAQDLSDPKCKRHALPVMRVENGVSTQSMVASWSKEGFCIRAFGDPEREIVRELHKAALNGDLLISLGGAGSNPFARAGLCLTILSKVPESYRKEVLAHHIDFQELQNAKDSTGIHLKLQKAGKEFHALKESWSKEIRIVSRPERGHEKEKDHTLITDHPVIFFLNPRDQKKYNHGWFTVEELEAWCLNEGPVLKT